MDCKRTLQNLMACSALVGACLLIPGTAPAQSLSDAEKIQKLERQTELLQKQSELLQRQLKEVKDELARARQKPERMEASAQSVAASPPAPRRDPKSPIVKAPAAAERIKVTLNGFVTADTVWRQRNQVADVATPFGAIPFPFSPLYNEHEFHGSARKSQLQLLFEGNIDSVQKLSGYFETDFLGVGGGPPAASNYTETNSWPPRLRQAWLTYDNTASGFHFLAGQAWTLATQNRLGIAPRRENIPNTIEASYVVGFDYLRQWQLRAVQDFGPVSLGISIENPAMIVAASTATAPTGVGGPFASGGIINGIEVNFANTAGGGGFTNGVTITTDQIPDIIEKAAFDPGWGHYEIFGLQRFFSDNTLTCVPGPCIAGSTAMTGPTTVKTRFGGGVGGSMLLPLIPNHVDPSANYLEFTGSILYGRGVGRYATGQLPDVTIAADGSLTPLVGLSALVGLIARPLNGLDIYAYAGIEQVSASYFNSGTALFGYGNPGFSNVGCTIVTPSSFALAVTAAPANCIGNNRRLSEVTVGFWQDIYRSKPLGRVRVGAQYEYIRREVFAGIGGAPATDNNIFLTSIRYFLPDVVF